MKKRPISIIGSDLETKFLFINETGTWACITGITSILEGGTPQVPEDEESDDADSDATFVGRVAGDEVDGEVDLEHYQLPQEALDIVMKYERQDQQEPG